MWFCQKKEIEIGTEGVYLRYYRGDEDKSKMICYDCYEEKEQEYLENYEFIYTYNPQQIEKKETGYIKSTLVHCPIDKKNRKKLLRTIREK